MDLLTHTLTGLALSRAGLNRVVPRAGLILALAANAPDLDVISAVNGSLSYLNWHRGVTHGLLAVPLLAVLPVLVARLVGRKSIPWLRAYLVSCAGVLTHPILDWTNVYGVRLLAPYSTEWFRGDFLHLFDLWIWALLVLTFAWPWLSGLVSSEIGARTTPGRGLAIFSLSVLLVYGSARYILHQRAVETLDARLHAGAAPVQVAAVPGPVNPFLWTGIVEGENFWMIHRVALLHEFDPGEGRVYHKPEPSPVIDAARRTPEFQQYLRFARYAHWRVTPLDQPEGARLVEAMDLRFGTPAEPRFVIGATVFPDLRVEQQGFRFGGLSVPGSLR